MNKYKTAFKQDRVILIEDQSCDKLKYYISKCDVMIAARTHASIAAYSQCIPTLVIGYSVKSKGIASDLFGTDENFVLPVDKISNENCILDAFLWIFEHRIGIQKQLKKIIPGYIQETNKMSKLIMGRL